MGVSCPRVAIFLTPGFIIRAKIWGFIIPLIRLRFKGRKTVANLNAKSSYTPMISGCLKTGRGQRNWKVFYCYSSFWFSFKSL